MADLQRLSNALKAAHAAGDTVSAAKLAQAIRKLQATPAAPAGDTSMGTAFAVADKQAEAAGNVGSAAITRRVNQGPLGQAQEFMFDKVGNPVREFFGMDPVDIAAVNQASSNEATAKAQQAQQSADQFAQDSNFENLTLDSVNDLGSFFNYVGQKGAQAAPYMATSLASGGTVTYPFSVGEISGALEEIEGKSQEEKDKIATRGGAIMTALENLGIASLLPAGVSNNLIGGIASGAISEGFTEGVQELVVIGSEAVAGKKFTEEELVSRLKEATAAGAAVGGSFKAGGQTINATSKIFSSDGSLNNPDNMSAEGAAAAGDLARTFKAITDANPDFNLKDVDKTSAKGARAVVDQAHIQLTEALKQRFADMKSRVKPNQVDTFESVSEKILAQAAYREGRNKTKSIVGNQELDALKRLAGDTREGQEAVNLILQLNQLTELHNSGYQGGLSSFTDQFSVFGSKVGYDKGAVATERLLRPLISGGAAVQTGGLSIPAQMAVSGGGRAIDKLTGNYSQIDKFVRRNSETPGLQPPTAPSLRDAAAAQLQADEDAKLREEALRTAREAEQRELNLQLAQQDAPATPGSPQFTMEDATGLSRDGVARILRVLKGRNDNPALIRAIQEYEQSVATGGRIEDLSPLIRAVRQFQQDNPDYVPMVRPPNSLSSPMLANVAAPGQAPNVDTTEANPVQAQTFGPQLTTQENYNRGIEANQAMNAELVEGVTTDPNLNRVQKGRLITSLDVLANNLGSDPVAAAQEQVQKLEEAGVPQEAIDTYVKPYVDRVTRQQSRPASAAPGLQAAQEAGVAPTTETQAPLQPTEDPIVDSQENYAQALNLVMDEQKVSASFVQRRLGIGFNEAADIVQRMEDEGLISKPNHVGARKILRQVPPRMSMPPQGDSFDYRMQHQPSRPEDGAAPLWDMTGNGEVFPDDIYGPNGLRYYGNPNYQPDRESYEVISSVMGDPDAEVTIYRAVPDEADIDTINVGDFVTLSRTYAEQHAEGGYGPLGQDSGKILSKVVKAKEVFSDGNDLNEFGYFPNPQARMAMAPQEDTPAVNPKKPQAPRLAPEQIPTQTRKVYKLMKVQPSRPGEVLPLFAKSGGHKGSPSGYTFGEWFGAEVQRPKLGDGLLAMRPGIHAVNLPVFDQGKAKVTSEQRVWVEVEIPAITEQTQAESDNSPILPNGSRSGVTERLIAPNESYDYKTNPNASNDAGGWPITGSMKALRIVPDAEIAQILRDNGLDHQVDNSFSDVDEAKAQQLMQPATPVRMAMAPEGEPQPIPRGETTNIQMPNELGTTFDFAKNSNFAKGRDFKEALQEKALAAQKEEGIDLSELSDENISRLADYVVADALVALQDNANAIGWYDRTVSDALASLAKIYPEIQTNPANRLQFIWALAVTSNGTKVDKNFELAADAYDHLQRTGRFPTNIGIGEAARAINGGLQQYHTMLDKFDGDHARLEEFMNSQVPVKQIEQEYGVQISGEGKNTLVRGASILGPKIGNGFFSNLYGNFDALTMDRWLMRTVGRHRGTLININMPMVKKKTGEIKTLLKDASPETMKALRQIFKPTGVKIGKNLSTEDIYRLAVRIAKESTSKPWREGLNGVSADLRKAGNALAKYLDGQVEAPAGAKERDFIRAVFTQALGRLNTEPSVTRRSNQGLTMSDLQALLWYPEKRLYDTAKAKEGEESRGYADDEAPDYANAARKLAERRQANAVGNRLGSPGPDGPGGGAASGPNARQSQPPVTDGVAGILASRLAGGPAQRASVPSTQEVKQAVEPARAIIEVGKKGSKYEDGIKDINQVRELADAINVTLQMYNDQKRMRMDAGAPDATQALGLYTDGTAYSLTPSASRSEFQTYITTLHEVAHGLNDQRYSPGDMRTFSPEQQQQLMGTLAGYPPPMTNKLTGRKEQFRRASFDEYIGKMLSGRSSVPKDLQKKIFKEIQDLQDKGKYRDGSDVRYEGGAKTSSSTRRPTAYYKYIRSSPEFAVDPVIYYLHDPKGMKKNYPVTAEAIREFFRLSTKVKFYSHPLAMAFAVALAMLMKAEQEDEQEKQMPPGALNQPMMPGALSA